MLALFNFGSKLSLSDGDLVVANSEGITLSAFPKGPTIIDDDLSDRITVESPYFLPPQEVLGSSLAATWNISYNISADDWNLSG